MIKYKTYRNFVNNTIKFKKKQHYENTFKTNSNNIKDTWQTIKKLINKKKEIHNSPLIINNDITHEPQYIANSFNEYFTSLFNNPTSFDPKLKNYLTPSYPSSCYFKLTNPAEVLHLTNSLSNSKSLDNHNLSNKTMKSITPSICNILTYLFNKSLNSGIFPDCLKTSKVIPIHKSGPLTEITNYRPISLVPSISKILEKIIKIRLDSFFNKHHIITDAQYGFRNGLSTELALLKLHNTITNNLSNNLHNLLVFIDFSKAFDSIHHDILTYKLQHYGIRGIPLNLLRSYLTNRSQYVNIDGINSPKLPIVSGVPQGSVLGPLLFNIFLNDIVNIQHPSKLIIFADDCTLCTKSPDLHDLTNITEHSLSLIGKWSTLNKLTINLQKTKFMVITYNKNLTTDDITLKLNDSCISKVDKFKLLGIYIDHRLNFNDHIEYILTKININLGIIFRIKKHLNGNTKKLLYDSLIFSHLFYGNLIWGCTNISSINKLFIVQKKIIKALFKTNNLKSNLNIFNINNVLTIFEINSFKSSLLTFKLINNILTTSDDLINNTFKIAQSSHSNRITNTNLIKPLLIKNKITSRNFCHYGPQYWNKLPLYLRLLTNFIEFKKNLKTYYNCFS